MDLTYAEEHILLRDTAERFLADHAPAPGGDPGPSLWERFAELGWLALPLPEDVGGLGGGPVEVAILAEALGRHLVRDPFVPAVVLAAGLVARAGTAAQRSSLLPGVGMGETRLALAHAEPGARNAPAHVATRAWRQGSDWVLDGRKEAVLGAAEADRFIVSARLDGDVRSRAGIALFLVPRSTPGLSVDTYATVDGTAAGTVTLTGVRLGADALLGDSKDAFAHLEAASDTTIVAWSWELVGMMEALLAATAAYAKVRVQFGRPLAANQVLRHRMVDMQVACEESRSTALRASLLLDADAAVRGRAASAAKVKVARAARFVAEQAVQTHGAMGVTDELAIGAFLKRVIALEALFGSPEHHLRRFAELSAAARRDERAVTAP